MYAILAEPHIDWIPHFPQGRFICISVCNDTKMFFILLEAIAFMIYVPL